MGEQFAHRGERLGGLEIGPVGEDRPAGDPETIVVLAYLRRDLIRRSEQRVRRVEGDVGRDLERAGRSLGSRAAIAGHLVPLDEYVHIELRERAPARSRSAAI